MTPPVNILAYGPNPDAPSHMRWAAAMVSDRRPGSYWLSTGATPDQAREKLMAMWRKQYPEETKRGAHLRKRAIDDLV